MNGGIIIQPQCPLKLEKYGYDLLGTRYIRAKNGD